MRRTRECAAASTPSSFARRRSARSAAGNRRDLSPNFETRPEFSEAGDYLALFAAIAVGTVCFWHLVGGARWRPIAIVLYPLACFAALVMFSFSFLCTMFQECL
jgi:hypothetical protein